VKATVPAGSLSFEARSSGTRFGRTASTLRPQVATINLLRAGFEAAEYVPRGPNAYLMNVLEEVENLLMLWRAASPFISYFHNGWR